MKKNTAGQKIGAQLVSATDGSAFTGAVTVSVTGDAGTQATGSVGSGACTHEGNGYHTYAPAQAETNYDLVAFTFTGTGAIPVTVQVYTTFPQTGDSYAEVTSGTYGLSVIESYVDLIDDGTSGLAKIATDVAAILVDTGTTLQAELDGIQADTEDIQTRLPAALVGGRIDATVDATGLEVGALALINAEMDTALADYAPATAANLATVAGYLDTEIAAILADTNELQTDLVNGGRLDLLIDAIKAKTDSLTFTVASTLDCNVTHAEGQSTVDGLAINVLLQRIHSYLWSKRSGLNGTDPDTVTIRNFADTADVGTITFDGYGNNTAST